MKLEYFHYLLKIDQLHSISAAAHALHISQTTLSSVVKAVEAELGITIFQRSIHGVSTTVEGQRLMSLAWEIDVKHEELMSLKNHRDNIQVIAIPMSPSVNVGLAVPLSQTYSRFELHGDISLDECPTMEVYARVKSKAANIGVTNFSDSEMFQIQEDAYKNKIQIEELYSDRLYLLTPSTHWIASRQSIGTDEVASERLAIVTSFQADLNNQLFRELTAGGQSVFFPNIATMRQAILEQNMIGLVTGYSIRSNLEAYQNNYHITPIHTNGREWCVSIYLIHRSDRSLRPQERILVSCIKEHFRTCPSALLRSVPALEEPERRPAE